MCEIQHCCSMGQDIAIRRRRLGRKRSKDRHIVLYMCCRSLQRRFECKEESRLDKKADKLSTTDRRSFLKDSCSHMFCSHCQHTAAGL